MEKNDNDYSKVDYDAITPKSMEISNKYFKKSDMSNMTDDEDYKSINSNDTNKTDNYIKGGKKRRTRRNKKSLTKRRRSLTKRRRSHKKRHYRK